MTYSRIDEERLVVGVLATDQPNLPGRARRRLRAEPERRVRPAQLRSAVEQARKLGPAAIRDFRLATEEAVARLHADPALQKAVAADLRKDFDETLNQSHDFLQLVKLVRGHAEALLHDRHPELDPVDAAERLPTEGAIYFSTEMMLVKMDAMRFVDEVNQALGSEKRFQIHPYVLKYARIYRWQADQKNLSIRMDGEARGHVRYNSDAIGALIQALLDNMVKYAPAGSRASVTFDESSEDVEIHFSSLGPRIDPDELERIFLPRYRGRAAQQMEASGLGVGLAAARHISDALTLGLSVEQDAAPDAKYAERYETTFSLRLRRCD